MKKAIALYRVSTYRQSVEGHSLEAQEKRVRKAAEYWEAEIVQEWKVDTSSKSGVNLARTDLQEALAYCSKFKIDLFIIDEVDRFMRGIDEYYWFKVEFRRLGVELIFASQPELSEQDQFAKLRELMAIYEAEASNAERSRKTLDKMKARVLEGYYPFYPHQGYKTTEAADGLHIPDESRFSLLQFAFKAIANEEMTPKEAQLWLESEGYTTPKGNRVLDMNHFHSMILDPYYAGILKIKSWDIEARGLHEPMITEEEYKRNVEIILERVISRKKQFNPDYPLTQALHWDCYETEGKVTGALHTNGKGWERKEYRCRSCNKAVPQEDIHESLNETLEELKLSQGGLEELKKALSTVWNSREQYRVKKVEKLKEDKQQIEERKGQLIHSLSSNPDLAEDIRSEIVKTKNLIEDIENKISELSHIDEEFLEFIDYGLNYINDLREKWWTLPPESLNECKQLLFKNKIILSQERKVYTPQISEIYSLASIKKAPENTSDAHLVELAVIATASEG